MIVISLLGGLGLLALPGLTHAYGRRLHPAEWARLCQVALVSGALVVEATLLLSAAPVVAQASGLPGVAAVCDRFLGPWAPGHAAASWAAAVVAIVLPGRAAQGWWRAMMAARAAWVEGGIGQRYRHRPHVGPPDAATEVEVVVLPVPDVMAVSVPLGPPARSASASGQVLVSEGLVDALSSHETEAVLAHEAAHLVNRHHRYLHAAAALELAFGWLPGVNDSTAVLRLSLERWADEEAAAACGRATVRAALVAVTAALVSRPVGVVAFSTADTIRERLEALAREAPRPPLAPHLLLYVPGVLLGGLVLAGLSCWADGANELLATVASCPT